MEFGGVIIGLCSFITIGIFHPIVIKSEYYIGKKVWPAFLILGIVSIVLSLFQENIVIASLLGVLGFSFFWSIQELFDQEKRVQKGWFPANPNKKK